MGSINKNMKYYSLKGEPSSKKSKKKSKKKRKKQNELLKPFEKQVRSFAKNMDKSTAEYYSGHEKSNKKKKNGWIRDYPKNASKALSKMGVNSGLIPIPGVKLPKLF